MRCYVCGVWNDTSAFYKLEVVSPDGYASLNNRIVGRVTLWACPVCGALHSDVCGQVEKEDRKP
jgi:hypothetical protein